MAAANNFDGYIFDYGGVLVHHQKPSDHTHMAEAAGIPADLFSELYWSLRFDYDKGLITGSEYWAAIGRQAGRTLQPAIIDALISADSATWMNFDEPVWQWVKELRAAGKRLAMLSNMPFDLGEAIKARTDRMKYFDFVTLSYEVQSIKPEPAIYEHCLAGIGTAAGRTVFFDDRIANIRGAEMLGIHAVEFPDSVSVLSRMRA